MRDYGPENTNEPNFRVYNPSDAEDSRWVRGQIRTVALWLLIGIGFILAFTALAASCALPAEPTEVARARAALTRAFALDCKCECGCKDVGYCQCGENCVCTCGCGRSPGGLCSCGSAQELYGKLSRKAFAENRPLVVWVGTFDKSAAKRLPHCVHFACDTFDGSDARRVIVAGKGAGSDWLVGLTYKSVEQVLSVYATEEHSPEKAARKVQSGVRPADVRSPNCSGGG